MITPKILEEKISKIKAFLRQEFAVERIGYFGSFAKGNYHEDSDIDILIELDKEKSLGWNFFDLKDYLEEVFEKKVDLVTENSLRAKWRNQILSEVKFI